MSCIVMYMYIYFNAFQNYMCTVHVNLLLNYLLNIIACTFYSQCSFQIQTDLAIVHFLHTGVQCKVASLPGSKGSTQCFMVYYMYKLQSRVWVFIRYSVPTLHSDLKYFSWSISFTVVWHTGIGIILSTEPYVVDPVLAYTSILCHVCIITFYGVSRNRIAIRTA